MVNLVYVWAGIVLTVAARLLLKYLSSFTELSVYEVTSDMVPIDRDLLEEIAEHVDPAHGQNYRYQRKRLRLDVEAIKVRFRRILANAEKPRHWAMFDRRMIRKKRLEYGPEVSDAIKEVLALERDLRWLVKRVLFRIWLWNLTAFERREWGPVPDLRKLRIAEILQAYDKLKQASIDLARAYGEGAIAEEIATVM